MKRFFLARPSRIAALLLLPLAAGCGALRPATTPQPTFYSLDRARLVAPAARPVVALGSIAAPTLIVNPPHAASGFDSPRIIYVRAAHQVEYFAHNEWVDTPARMLAPLIVAALENNGAFGAVMSTPAAAVGDFRLDTEIIRLHHDFGSQPSRVRFTLRATLVGNPTRRVMASREFDTSIAAASEDPYGGVVAANRAVQAVLEDLSAFCAEAVRAVPTEK